MFWPFQLARPGFSALSLAAAGLPILAMRSSSSFFKTRARKLHNTWPRMVSSYQRPDRPHPALSDPATTQHAIKHSNRAKRSGGRSIRRRRPLWRRSILTPHTSRGWSSRSVWARDAAEHYVPAAGVRVLAFEKGQGGRRPRPISNQFVLFCFGRDCFRTIPIFLWFASTGIISKQLIAETRAPVRGARRAIGAIQSRRQSSAYSKQKKIASRSIKRRGSRAASAIPRSRRR